MTTKRQIEISHIVYATIEIEQAVIDQALDPEWQRTYYNLETPEEVARHITYNLLRGATLSQLDGFADREDSEARLIKEEWEPDD